MPRRRGVSASSEAQPGGRPAGTSAVVAVALIGALLVLIAQFTTLYSVHIATSSIPVKTVGTGGNHGWGPIPIALVCFVLAASVYRAGNRIALLGLVVLGVATLLIALLADLPDVHATGLVGSTANQFARAANSPSAGLYLETLGAVLVIVSGGVGLLMLGAAPRRPRRGDSGDSAPDPGDSAPDPGDSYPDPGDSAPDPGDSDPDLGDPAPKGPLKLKDSGRRKWSAS